MKNKSLILASSSPRRLSLLTQIGVIPDQIIPSDINECPLHAELPRDLAKRLAFEKCKTVSNTHSESFVLAADTVVAVGRKILGKPDTEEEASEFLNILSGRRHKVHGAIALFAPQHKIKIRYIETTVSFKRLSDSDIKTYVSSGEWHGKAGGYAIQGYAESFVQRINGSYSNVVGLSLYDTMVMLRGAGYLKD